VKLCPPAIDALTLAHDPLFVHVLPSMVVVVLVVVSRNVIVAQPFCTRSGQWIWYHTVSVLDAPLGVEKVCTIVESPFVAAVLPTTAAYVLKWPGDCTPALPAEVHPLSVSVSNPPFTMSPPPLAVTVNVTGTVCVTEVPVPVTVSVYVPAGTDAATARPRFDDPPEVTEVGENVAVTPLGAPVNESATVCAAPDVVAVLTVVEPDAPWTTDTEVGDAVTEKSGVAVTVSVTVVLCVADGAVPVRVIGYVPGATPAFAVIVKVELPPLLTDAGANPVVTPDGAPEAESAMVSALPLVRAVATVVVLDGPP